MPLSNLRPLSSRTTLSIGVVIATLLYLCVLLVGPRVDTAEIEANGMWLYNVTLNGVFGISLNKDSFIYLEATIDPSQLLAEKSVLQSRPLLPLLLHYPAQLLDPLTRGGLASSPQWTLVQRYGGAYIAFLLFNLLVLWVSFRSYVAVTTRHAAFAEGTESYERYSNAAFLLGSLLVFNDLVKAFFFAAHTQLLNIGVPMLAIAVSWIAIEKGMRVAEVTGYGLLTGLGVLAYGSFFLLGAILMLALLIHQVRHREDSIRRQAAKQLILALLTVLPYLLWKLYVEAVTGGYYVHEPVVYRQVVWVADVMERGWAWLLAALWGHFSFLCSAAFHQMKQYAALPFVLLYFAHCEPDFWRRLRADRWFFGWVLMIALIFLLFFSVVGHDAARLSFPVVVAAIAIVGRMLVHLDRSLPDARRTSLSVAVALLLVFQGILSVAKSGPTG